jgi:hypothetical protein
MSTRQERKDAAYLEQMQALAAQASPPPNPDEETRRWEGSAAVIQARVRTPYRAYVPSYDDRQTDPFAILALVFGILGGVLGVIFGHVAIYRIGKSGDKGEVLATVGLVFGYLSLAIWVVVLIVS